MANPSNCSDGKKLTENGKKRGIPLVVLIVIFMILAILLGIAISLLAGYDGIIVKNAYAKEQMKIEEYQKEIESVILEESDLESKSQLMTIAEALEKIVDSGITTKENISETKNKGYIVTKEGYVFKLTYGSNYDIDLEYVGLKDSITPTIEIEKSSDTFTSKVTVTVRGNISITGIESIEQVGGKKITYDEMVTSKTEKFEVTQNGTYTYKVTGKNGTYVESEVKIYNIDEPSPTATYTISPDAENYGQTVEITLKAEGKSKIVSITTPDEKITKNTDEVKYLVNENGKYKFIIEDEEKVTSEYLVTVKNIDNKAPNKAIIKFNKTSSDTASKISATVFQYDTKSLVDIEKCRWEYNTEKDELGTDASKYSGTFESENDTLELSMESIGTYYLHVLTVDNAGNAVETISNSVTANSLAMQAKIGDYVDIGVTYEDKGEFQNSFTQSLKALNGWRVLNIDNKLGVVTLVSASCPLTYHHVYGDSYNSINNLNNMYKALLSQKDGNKSFFSSSGFKDEENNEIFDMTEVFGKNTYIDISKGIHALGAGSEYNGTETNGEIETAYKNITGKTVTMTELKDMEYPLNTESLKKVAGSKWQNSYTDLLGIGEMYWIGGTYYSNSGLWFALDNSVMSYNMSKNIGVRLVVTLKAGIKISDTNIGDGSSESTAYTLENN